jgi:hypothetical protein
MFGFDTSGEALFKIVQQFCIVPVGSEEMTNTLVVGNHSCLQKPAFGYEQDNANVNGLTASEIGAILNDAVMAFNWIHDSPPSERSIVSWGGSNNLDSIVSATKLARWNK